MPAIKQISFEKALLAEDWTLTCLSDSTPDAKKVHFKVTGSLTGDDGEGYSTERFVSQSGRVVIEPADWHLEWSLGYKKLTLPEGFQVKWKTYPLFTAKYQPQSTGAETVLVQNCATTTHKLTLKGSASKLGITGFRVYAPRRWRRSEHRSRNKWRKLPACGATIDRKLAAHATITERLLPSASLPGHRRGPRGGRDRGCDLTQSPATGPRNASGSVKSARNTNMPQARWRPSAS